MEKHRIFSVRETLLGGGEPGDRFHRCLTNAKRFLDATSVAGLLDLLMEREENRRVIRNAMCDILHVGFIIPNGELTIADMSSASQEAGFGSGQSTSASTVIARELGEFTGRRDIPTTIFTAHTGETYGRSAYVEAFIPAAEKRVVRRWIDAEVGTHIGLTLASPAAFTAVRDAFQAEGFRMPLFMHGEQIANIDRGCTVSYYEKFRGSGKLRIEVLLPTSGDPR